MDLDAMAAFDWSTVWERVAQHYLGTFRFTVLADQVWQLSLLYGV
jgi:hypothetical protein